MKLETDLADYHHGVGLLVGHFLLEQRLVVIRVELFVDRVDLFESVALEDSVELSLGHREAFVEGL